MGSARYLPPLQVAMLTCTALMLEYDARAASPSSLPMPDCLTPPNGIRKSESLLLLIQTMPASISLATRCARTRSLVNSAAPSPYDVLFASSSASSSVENDMIDTQGPKISSWKIFMVGL